MGPPLSSVQLTAPERPSFPLAIESHRSLLHPVRPPHTKALHLAWTRVSCLVTKDIVGWTILCCGGLFCSSWEVQHHSWPLLPRHKKHPHQLGQLKCPPILSTVPCREKLPATENHSAGPLGPASWSRGPVGGCLSGTCPLPPSSSSLSTPGLTGSLSSPETPRLCEDSRHQVQDEGG